MDREKLKNLLGLLTEELWHFLRFSLILYGLFFIGFYAGFNLYAEKMRAQELNPISSPLLTDIELDQKEEKPSSSEIEPLTGLTKSSGAHSENKLQNELHIPILNLRAPIIVMNSLDPEDYKEVLKKGVALYPSVLPGEKGRTIVLGHSAPPNWPKINYDWVFNNLNDLKKGNTIIVAFKDEEYIFKVKASKILNKGQNLPLLNGSNSSSELVLITCWPPGIDYKRLAIFAEQN